MSDKETNMIFSICSTCSYYIKYLDKNTTLLIKRWNNIVTNSDKVFVT